MPVRERLNNYDINRTGKRPQQKSGGEGVTEKSTVCVLGRISVNHVGPNRNED